jgi:hypothetical protein
MKFVISWEKEDKPFMDCELKEITLVDERMVDDPSKVIYFCGETDWWYKEGTNHRIENGHIKRDLVKPGWCKEISSLEELLDIVKGRASLKISWYCENFVLSE